MSTTAPDPIDGAIHASARRIGGRVTLSSGRQIGLDLVAQANQQALGGHIVLPNGQAVPIGKEKLT